MKKAVPKGYLKFGLLELAIRDVLSQYSSEDGMTSYQIENELKENGIERNYDTIMRHLKKMVDTGFIARIAKGGDINENKGRRHWNYFYKNK